MKDNILKVYDSAYPVQVEIGLEWYNKAHRLARDMSIKYKLKSYRYAAGIISALSPAVRWERNVLDAHAVLAAEDDNDIKVNTYGQFLSKALAIKHGTDPDEVIIRKTGPKTWAFYRCICQPKNDLHVVVDRHALAVAIGRTATDYEKGRMSKVRGALDEVVNAYKEAAIERGVLPMQMQAVTWVTHRDSL